MRLTHKVSVFWGVCLRRDFTLKKYVSLAGFLICLWQGNRRWKTFIFKEKMLSFNVLYLLRVEA